MSFTNDNLTRYIFHLVIESEFNAQCREGEYLPVRFELDGFIHCTGEWETTLLVAKDYFLTLQGQVLVLKLALDRIKSNVVFESPIPLKGGGEAHLRATFLFPHIYGPLNLDAVETIQRLIRLKDGFALET